MQRCHYFSSSRSDRTQKAMLKAAMLAFLLCAAIVDAFAWAPRTSGPFSSFHAIAPRRCHAPLTALRATGIDAETDDGNIITRRSLLSTAGLVAAGATLTSRNQQDTPWLLSSSNEEPASFSLASLDQAMQVLESSVDKRFLHAVVASDYQSLYAKRPTSMSNQNPSVAYASALLKDDNHRQGLQTKLVVQLKDRPIQVDQSVLVHSQLDTAAKLWGAENVVSIWPLVAGSSSPPNVHYAWPALGGSFVNAIHKDDIIVDGIDCGRMSLEDALQGDMQVFLQAERFLLIPVSLELSLGERLQRAFLI